jgi:hypothetical protein
LLDERRHDGAICFSAFFCGADSAVIPLLDERRNDGVSIFSAFFFVAQIQQSSLA